MKRNRYRAACGIEERIRLTSVSLCIDVAAYCGHVNHYTWVVKIDPDEWATAHNDDFWNRWCGCLHKGRTWYSVESTLVTS